ncbi:MAG: hypothetical protein E6K79_01180 [Candidatus Eisenbacteria bacterium]|uniref:Uncharacterized protein n=1 Tax=Eiseniibacteriota bacterium TaxID=2212470 RepID=A0A538TTJ2_UNCEI|nr:MAG: hypothetical protein E6K79_01180 [Candidatus Eisenbacteria bacterium]
MEALRAPDDVELQPLAFDVRDRKAVSHALAEAKTLLSKLDILVNNAAFRSPLFLLLLLRGATPHHAASRAALPGHLGRAIRATNRPDTRKAAGKLTPRRTSHAQSVLLTTVRQLGELSVLEPLL